MKDLSSLLERSQTREAKIGNITTELGSELVMLADFLDNVSRRRPKGECFIGIGTSARYDTKYHYQMGKTIVLKKLSIV